eukprot:CAMPEP_0174313146 /NCGR_PEP_ID=MMETSP0810-20121108/4781_1 /TAXON_ID=73025 ORGANISM="Eutreptiella gymnastica-like, Strain CCMP1594" /NCGR_SAMPLE_ID=MMETSP0810 /ASSEMBLY_ACC=CAM_ASM_000659 /LENGTH=47 /DNA_ID= /DNA_START= /DNA_END= /DNA_ORIENTATION=
MHPLEVGTENALTDLRTLSLSPQGSGDAGTAKPAHNSRRGLEEENFG